MKPNEVILPFRSIILSGKRFESAALPCWWKRLRGIAPLNRKFLWFFSLSFAVFSLMGTFHHHPDGVKQESCSLCKVLSYHSEYCGPDVPSLRPEIPAAPAVLAGDSSFHPSSLVSSPFGRSPPHLLPLY